MMNGCLNHKLREIPHNSHESDTNYIFMFNNKILSKYVTHVIVCKQMHDFRSELSWILNLAIKVMPPSYEKRSV